MVTALLIRIVHKIYLTNFVLSALFVRGLIANEEVIERGRVQYDLLKKKADLPQYGSCWKSAVQHLDKGCRYLTESIQSEIALHITNCFLEMSGHPTYDCELDRKTNLRAICINSMSDRAFNVYTEFYTHTQSICWFLQGQVWNEIIADNTIKVGQQLKESALTQEGLLEAQKRSYELQVKMLQHGEFLENVLEDIFVSFKKHQDLLRMLSDTINRLQDWVIGEISWFDSIIFYTVSVLLVFTFTATQRTGSARLPMLFLFFIYLLIERFLCSFIVSNNSGLDAQAVYSHISDYIWYSRYGLIILAANIFIYKAIFQKDLLTKQLELLCTIQKQNSCILSLLKESKHSSSFEGSKINFVDEYSQNCTKKDDFSFLENGVEISAVNLDRSFDNDSNYSSNSKNVVGITRCNYNSSKKKVYSKTNLENSSLAVINKSENISSDTRTERYNLRSCVLR